MSALFSWIPGKCTTTFTSAPEPLIVQPKNGPKRAFPEIVKDTVPDCNLNPFLFNGHLQTAWTAYKVPGPQIHYKRRTFEAEDPAFHGHFCIDYAVAPPQRAGVEAVDGGVEDAGLREDPAGPGHYRLPPRTTYFTDKEFANLGSDDTKPLLIALHGLSGGSYEVYLRHVLDPLVAQTEEGKKAGGLSGGDWEALVVNSRGCAGSKISSSVLYNARATWDMRQVVKWARKTWPNRPLFGIGFSLGANILTNYLGEEGSNCLLNAAIVICNPWKLEVSSLNLKRTYFRQYVYDYTLGSAMKRLYETHKEQISKNLALDPERIRKIKCLYEFDREVQCATWGYPTETAYYRDASSSDSVMAIRIPTLCLHATDDPISANEAVPFEEIRQNPYVVMAATSSGGHIGWFEFGGGRWHVKPCFNFLNAMADIDPAKNEVPKPIVYGPQGGHQTPFSFDPMRRKAFVTKKEQ